MLRFFRQCYTLLNTLWALARRHAVPVFLVFFQQLGNYTASIVLALVAFYLSLLTTSLPPAKHERAAIDRAIAVLADKGYDREVFLLRRTVTFRGTDHWLNNFVEKENAYASTNFPFQIVTLYPDFYGKAADDTERAMVLLHEARHLMGENENQAYSYVWQNRKRLGWTLQTHGTTESYVTIEQQTRENAPELFNCPEKSWDDCTE
jgi:hypothetical protein